MPSSCGNSQHEALRNLMMRSTDQQDRGAAQNDREVSDGWHNVFLAIENARLDGLEIDPDAKALLELQASGLMSADETVARLKELYRPATPSRRQPGG